MSSKLRFVIGAGLIALAIDYLITTAVTNGGGSVSPRSPRLTSTGAGKGETEALPKRPRI
jgi:hypothetical protein